MNLRRTGGDLGEKAESRHSGRVDAKYVNSAAAITMAIFDKTELISVFFRCYRLQA